MKIWELKCENALFKNITKKINIIDDNMSELEQLKIKTQLIPEIREDIKVFCEEKEVNMAEVTNKIRKIISNPTAQNITENRIIAIDEILNGIENSIQLEGKDII